DLAEALLDRLALARDLLQPRDLGEHRRRPRTLRQGVLEVERDFPRGLPIAAGEKLPVTLVVAGRRRFVLAALARLLELRGVLSDGGAWQPGLLETLKRLFPLAQPPGRERSLESPAQLIDAASLANVALGLRHLAGEGSREIAARVEALQDL